MITPVAKQDISGVTNTEAIVPIIREVRLITMVLAHALVSKLHNDLNSRVAHSFPYCLTCKPEQKFRREVNVIMIASVH